MSLLSTLWTAGLIVAMSCSFTAHSASPGEGPANSPTAATSQGAPYTVEDGNKVDDNTLAGWKTWRALDCARCHGANQEGLVGPSLVEALKTIPREEFEHIVLEGRIQKGMPPFGGVKRVVENIDNLYAYLKGRSDGKIEPGRVEAISK
jgi:mono/diheme cytochrome c family protein